MFSELESNILGSLFFAGRPIIEADSESDHEISVGNCSEGAGVLTHQKESGQEIVLEAEEENEINSSNEGSSSGRESETTQYDCVCTLLKKFVGKR